MASKQEWTDFRQSRFTNIFEAGIISQINNDLTPSAINKEIDLNPHVDSAVKTISKTNLDKNKLKVFSFLLKYRDKAFQVRKSWPEREEMLKNVNKFIADFSVESFVQENQISDSTHSLPKILDHMENYPMVRLYTNEIGHRALFHGHLLPSNEMKDMEKIARGHTLFSILEVELKYYFLHEMKPNYEANTRHKLLYRGEYWDERKLLHIQSTLEWNIMKRFIKQYVPLFSTSAEENVARDFIARSPPKLSLHKCLLEIEVIPLDAHYLQKFQKVSPKCEIESNVATDISEISCVPREKEHLFLDGPMAVISCDLQNADSNKRSYYKVRLQVVNAKLQGVWYEPYQNIFKKIYHYSLFAANKDIKEYEEKAKLFAADLDAYFEEFDICYRNQTEIVDESIRISIARSRSWDKISFYDFIIGRISHSTEGKTLRSTYQQLKANLQTIKPKINSTTYSAACQICENLLDSMIDFIEGNQDQDFLLKSLSLNYWRIVAQNDQDEVSPVLNGAMLVEVEQYLQSLPALPSEYKYSLPECHENLLQLINSLGMNQSSSTVNKLSQIFDVQDLMSSLINHVSSSSTTKSSFFSAFPVDKLVDSIVCIIRKIEEKSPDNLQIHELNNRFNQMSTYFKAMPALHFTNNEVVSSFVNEDGIEFLNLIVSTAKEVFGHDVDDRIMALEILANSLKKFNEDSINLGILEDESRKSFWLLPVDQHKTYSDLMVSRKGAKMFIDLLIRALFTNYIVNLTKAEDLDLGQFSWIIGKSSGSIFTSSQNAFDMD